MGSSIGRMAKSPRPRCHSSKAGVYPAQRRQISTTPAAPTAVRLARSGVMRTIFASPRPGVLPSLPLRLDHQRPLFGDELLDRYFNCASTTTGPIRAQDVRQPTLRSGRWTAAFRLRTVTASSKLSPRGAFRHLNEPFPRLREARPFEVGRPPEAFSTRKETF